MSQKAHRARRNREVEFFFYIIIKVIHICILKYTLVIQLKLPTNQVVVVQDHGKESHIKQLQLYVAIAVAPVCCLPLSRMVLLAIRNRVSILVKFLVAGLIYNGFLHRNVGFILF